MNYLKSALLLAAAFTFWSEPVQAASKKHILGIFYEGCEKTCEGFKAEIAKSGFDADVEVVDVKQDKTKLPEIIKQVQITKPDLVLVYGTTATLGTIGTLAQSPDAKFISDIPVVFTAVADPVGSGVVESFAKSGRNNVTGTYNRVPEKLNIEVIRRYDPNFSKLGLLFNSSEKNSVSKMEELAVLAPGVGIELVAVEVDPANKDKPDPAQIAVRLQELHDKGVKWVYLGSSSFLNSNGKIFTEAALKNGIAIVSPYPALVKDHPALLSIAAPREEVGALAAQQALSIIRDGAKPGDLPIQQATHFTYVVNLKVAEKLGLNPPQAFKGKDTEFVQDFFLPAN
jgi:putative tryptophan/tyrosine transport system substrate-binding protein